MRMLRRNLTEFEYLPYSGVDSGLNSEGEHTGEYQRQYDDPILYKGNISTPSGYTNQTFYGTETRYTHVLIMDDPEVDIRESGLIRWKGNLYEIRSVRPSLNVMNIALRKITPDEGEPYPVPDENQTEDEEGTEVDSGGEG